MRWVVFGVAHQLVLLFLPVESGTWSGREVGFGTISL